jgi:hypothetical protein
MVTVESGEQKINEETEALKVTKQFSSWISYIFPKQNIMYFLLLKNDVNKNGFYKCTVSSPDMWVCILKFP